MNILFLFSFVFSVVMAGEVPIPNIDVINRIKPDSDYLWTASPNPWAKAANGYYAQPHYGIKRNNTSPALCGEIATSYTTGFLCSDPSVKEKDSPAFDTLINEEILTYLARPTPWASKYNLLKIDTVGKKLTYDQTIKVKNIYIGKKAYAATDLPYDAKDPKNTKTIIKEDLKTKFKRFAALFGCEKDYSITIEKKGSKDVLPDHAAFFTNLYSVFYGCTDNTNSGLICETQDFDKGTSRNNSAEIQDPSLLNIKDLLDVKWKNSFMNKRITSYGATQENTFASHTNLADHYYNNALNDGGCIGYCTDVLAFGYISGYSHLETCGPIRLSSTFKGSSTELLDANSNIDFIKLAKSDKKYSVDNLINLACIDRNKDRFFKVIISASSSSDDNNGPLCTKDFIGLSKQRALTLKKGLVRNYIFALTGRDINAGDEDSLWEIDYYGENRDGTSGPCAYKIVNNVMGKVRDLEHVPDALLREFRGVKVQFFFNKYNQQAGSYNLKPIYSVGFESREVNFHCKDKAGSPKQASSTFMANVQLIDGNKK